ncbi:MobF family relaxase [Streptomonospora nanhaiensis]|uniref:MobF family relaxase n=1 Tax=Streptomonospora nanhaiensis TaxID=1323731 RepID=UPI001C993536|nr:MobF family relaxase [Streptomonospora nanhaiensis]MBX9387400.1 relaxase domain-containing protein [Streptomonospora nanhaiensis]
MAWVTTLGPDPTQVEYRLTGQCGCDAHAHAHSHGDADDLQVEYRIKDADRPLQRIGGGWSEFGQAPGSEFAGKADLEAMRRIMAGCHPVTGEVLVTPKEAVDPRAKLAARPLVDAVYAIADAAHMPAADLFTSAAAAERFARLERGLLRDGEAHHAYVRDLEVIAEQAGVDPAMLWDPAELATAREHADSRVRVGNRGFDTVLNMPKSMSVLYGLVEDRTAAEIEEIYLDCVRETVASLEEWAGYAVAGHHGDGRSAARVSTSGLIASITLHRSARPVDGRMGDPHLHAHVMIANMVRGEDGKWRALGAGGRDLHRHVAVAGELAKARMRERLSRRFGVVWTRDERTGEWEIAGFDRDVRDVFSSRSRQIADHVGRDASAAQARAAARELAQAKSSVRQGHARRWWRRVAREAGFDVDGLLDGALSRGAAARQPVPSVDELAAIVWDPETGVTAHRKAVSRPQIMAAVAAACPGGVVSASHLEVLTDAVLSTGRAVRLPSGGPRHLSNADRWTSADIVEAEQAIITAAERRLGEGAAVVPAGAAEEALRRFEADRGFALSAEQRRTAERLLRGGHGLDMVRGVAGSGKTTLMSAALAGWSAVGLRVEGAATAAVAAANLAAESGITSHTVATWLRRIESGEGLAGVDVLVVDEAAMVDDRSMSALVKAADASGTKIVGIGDPAQLRAVGVGGGFKAVHEIVAGETLTENRRQRNDVDRAALALWLAGGRATALHAWGHAGRVHAAERAHEALDLVARGWWKDRQELSDAHQAVGELLVLAARNSDVDELNMRMRALAWAGGHLADDEVAFALRGGGRLALASGDVVRVRRNDYRSRRGEGPDVLNGFRGVVAEVDGRRGARVEWRHEGETLSAWVSPEAIARGDLSHGYAMTIAAAQGLTCERAHVYGIGAEAHSLYPAMSRSRARADLYLAAQGLESVDVRGVRNDGELVRRLIDGYARTLTDRDDTMVSDELEIPRRASVKAAVEQAVKGRKPVGARRGGPPRRGPQRGL